MNTARAAFTALNLLLLATCPPLYGAPVIAGALYMAEKTSSIYKDKYGTIPLKRFDNDPSDGPINPATEKLADDILDKIKKTNPPS